MSQSSDPSMRALFEKWRGTNTPTDDKLSKQIQATYGVDLANASEDQKELVLYRMFLRDSEFWSSVA